VDEGTPFEVAEHAADPLGLPMPPFLLLQLVGPAIALHVAETMHAAYPDRFSVSPKLRALVEAGKTAVYEPDFSVDPEVAKLLAGGESPSTAEQVLERALTGLAEEIRIMLDEGVVAAPEDIDLCMILGAGWPFHLGGITPYLDRTGVAAKVTGAPFRKLGQQGSLEGDLGDAGQRPAHRASSLGRVRMLDECRLVKVRHLRVRDKRDLGDGGRSVHGPQRHGDVGPDGIRGASRLGEHVRQGHGETRRVRGGDELLRIRARTVLEAGLERVPAADRVPGRERARARWQVALPLGASLRWHQRPPGC
jgi:hypothetical protein